MVKKYNKQGFVDYDELFDKLLAMSIDPIFRTAFAGWRYGEKTGVALLDLRTGELLSKSVSIGSERECAAAHEIVVYSISADTNVLDWDFVLDQYDMLIGGLITAEQYAEIRKGNDESIIQEVREKYLLKKNQSFEELAIQGFMEHQELEWFFIHEQLRDKYRG
ncbi:hypothetical protein Cpap_4007 [Ruminiclostridium papyrosolvens DSM 2782]|jgi:hypothetical protein|uniref:Uncharacterized protein n=1 Tax=Ruminiclostridium papyrosolvens DSM 2782 TaxID=588581 RepID=F1T7X3_9FIRM|nr:hypothetical protein [Ruminiclostridium papyrosolvens]EGD49571.1 hypothetical protein Cpap_4007 [Ruminiclostridium papyrosolvens DSM 2782]WES33305.1 hypothetical protein P0092_16270 [Ruminiclostridium papyrosolvens DSM 2782]